MLKQIMNVRGIKNLSKETQETINGGKTAVCKSTYLINLGESCEAGYYQQGHCTCCKY